MKYIASTFLFTFLFLSSHSQNVRLSDLIKLNQNDVSFLNDFANKNGFTPMKHDSDEMSQSFEFLHKAIVNGKATKTFLAKFYYSRGKKMVSYQTKDAATYLSMQRELQGLGFVLASTNVADDIKKMSYRKADTEAFFYTITDVSPNGVKSLMYEISVKSKK